MLQQSSYYTEKIQHSAIDIAPAIRESEYNPGVSDPEIYNHMT